MSVTDLVKKRLLAGEALTTQQVSDDYNVSKSMLTIVVRDLEAEGHTIERETIGNNRKAYSILGAQAPSSNGDDPSAESAARAERRAKAKTRLPELGAELVVTSLNYDPASGDRTVTLQAGNQTWFMEVVK